MATETENKGNEEINQKSSEWAFVLDYGPKAFAVFVGCLYFSGFIVVNAHLSKYGLSMSEILNTNYVIAGSLFFFYLVCFYLFAGRATIFGKKWLGEDISLMEALQLSKKWHFVKFVHSFIHLFFFLCLSAALFSSIAFFRSGTSLFYVFLAVVFIITYPMDVTNGDIKYPRANEIIQILLKTSAIIVFFLMSEYLTTMLVFISYFTIMAFINLVLDTLKRYKTTKDRISFNFIYAAVFIVVTAASFGRLIYGNISTQIGGGFLYQVSFSTKHEIKGLNMHEAATNETKNEFYVGQLILQTNEFVYISIDGKTYRISTHDINLLRIDPPKKEEVGESVITSLINMLQRGRMTD